LAAVGRADETLTFERHIRPILKAHCFDCHGATAELEGEIDLRLRRFMLAGGESGPAIEPGNPDSSLLIERIREGEMPPGDKKMSPEELATIEKWIAAGAVTARDEPEQLDAGLGIMPEEREFWSFQPLKRPAVPDLEQSDRGRTPIDAFILAKLQEKGLVFSADADDRTLLTRVYFDLLGLPPSPAEVEAYSTDESSDKYEKLINTLLASPRYGERWARHWLDVVGYADTEGYTPADADRRWVYKYRDYVIKSLNADKPFDVFLQEQLAGDELVPQPHKNLDEDQIEKLIATGFLRMASDGTGSGANNDVARNQTISDTMKIVSSSLLGLSVGCAQCHDHRYDPISHVDYYQMRAIFEPALNWKQWRTPPQRLISLYTDEERKSAAEIEAEAKKIVAERDELRGKFIKEELEKELTKYEENLREKLRVAYHVATDKRTDEQKQLLKEYPAINISAGTLYQYNQASADKIKEYDKQIGEVRAKKPTEPFVRALTEIHDQVPTTHLFYRGDFKQPLQEVRPAGLTISSQPGEPFEISPNSEDLPTTGRRLAYARWLFSGSHPLVGRVLVNRMWMHHMGRGIVGTPADFGALGLRPTHPKLLDWLAVEFAESGWSLKSLHRKIMVSTVYRQSSQSDPAKATADGANQLYWRKPVLRLDAEVIHDRLLATSGILQHQLYGPATPIEVDDTGQTVVSGGSKRRGIYVKVKRTQPVALFKSFDAPVMEVNCECRPSSTVATQSLMLMNSGFILAQASAFAERVRREASAVAAPEIVFEPSQLVKIELALAARKRQTWDSKTDFHGLREDLPTMPRQVVCAWQLAYGRPPTEGELSATLDFLVEQFQTLITDHTPAADTPATGNPATDVDPEHQVMTNLCQVLLSSNEFLYVD
jgi:hypothetical protein